MNINTSAHLSDAICLGLMLAPFNVAFATQGTMPHGYGVKSEGMGEVALALSQDSLV